MQLEERIAPAVYGNPGIENSLLDASLADDDVVMVEIASAASFDIYTLDDAQLAGKLQLSFIDGFTPELGQSFQVLTASETLTGDFSAYEGLGIFDGLYLKPVIAGDTLSLEVAKIPGGALTTTVLDVVSAVTGDTFSLSVVGPGVFAVTVANAAETASLELEISEEQFLIKSASITIDQSFTIGSLVEVEGPTLTIEDFSISAAGVGTGSFSIGAASATLFPGKAFTATVEEFEFTFDTATSAFEITVGSFELSVGDAVVVTATSSDPETPAATFSYDPETIDVPGTEIGTVSILTITIPKLSGFTGTIEDLVIRNDGFAFANATVAVAGTFSIGSIAEVTDPSLTISDVDVNFAELEPFTGSITIAVANFTLFPDNSKFTASADDLSATFDFSEGKNGALTLEASAVVLTFGSVIEFAINGLTLDTSAEGDEPLAEVESCDVNLLSVGITGSGGPFQILADGSFVILEDFGVSLSLNNDAADTFKWPKWLPIQINSIGVKWPDFNADASDFTITFSATLNTASIGSTSLPLTVQGSVNNVVIDVGKLLDGEFPIVSMDDGLISVDGMLFGFEVTGTIIFGIVRVDANGDLINDDRFLLDEDTNPTDEESTADPEEDKTYFFGGLEVDIQVLNKGFGLKIGVSELGPMEMFISVGLPIILEPISGLAISNLRGGISFGNPIESITDPLELADAEFETPDELTALEWAANLKHQVANQSGNDATWAEFDSAFANPETIRITAGASLSSVYATNAAFHADVDITADLSGKFIFNAAGKLANDSIDLNFRAYLDLAEVDQGNATVLFLTNVMRVETGTKSSSPITVYGGVEFHYFDGNGDEIDSPDESSDSQHIQIIISGGAEFNTFEYFTATLTGTVTIEFDIQDTVLTFDMNGALDATYLGNIAQAAGHFTIDFGGFDDIPIIYGAMEVSSGEAFDLLAELGFEVGATGVFYINTDTIGHDVELTFTDGSTETVELDPLSVGLGVFGSLSWTLEDEEYLTIVGLLDVRVTAEDGAMIFVNATLNLGPSDAEILTMLAQGFLTVDAGGVAGMLELKREQSAPDFLGLGVGTAVSQTATFVLVFNTTEVDQVFELPEGIELPGLPDGATEVVVPAGPPPEETPATATTWEETDPGFYFVVHVSGGLEFLNGSLAVSGDFNMLLTEEVIDITVSATLSVFGSDIAVAGQARIEGGNFFCDISATASILPDPNFEISGSFVLHIDTDLDEYWVQVPSATVNLFGLKMTGGFRIGIDSSGTFSIDIPEATALTLDFFGIATFSVHGSFSTSEGIDFTATAAFDFTFGYDVFTVSLHGSMTVSFSSERFFAAFTAGVDFSGESIVDVKGSVEISSSFVYLSFAATVTLIPEIDLGLLGIIPAWRPTISFSVSIGSVSPPNSPPAPPPPVLGRMVGDVLYLNIGVDAHLRERFTTDNGETFTVSHVSGSVDDDAGETVRVAAFGTTKDFSGVRRIVATDAGEGGDVITIQSGVESDAELHGGKGTDRLSYFGVGSGTLHGDSGADSLIGSSGNDFLFGGDDDDLLTGEGGNDTLHAGDGAKNRLFGDADSAATEVNGTAGDDYIEGGAGSDTVFAGDGNDTFVGPLMAGSDFVDGGAGDNSALVKGTINPDVIVIGTTTLEDDSLALFIHFQDETAGNATLIGFAEVAVHGGDQGSTDPEDGFSVGRAGDVISAGDLTGTGIEVLTLYGGTTVGDQEQDDIEIHGTANADNLTIDMEIIRGVPVPVIVITGLPYLVKADGLEAAHDSVTVKADGGDDAFTLTNNGSVAAPRVENLVRFLGIDGGDGQETLPVVDDANFTASDSSLTRSTGGGLIKLNALEQVNLTGGSSANIFEIRASPVTKFVVNGLDPVTGTVPPNTGDYLKLDTTQLAFGTGRRRLHITSLGIGFWSFARGGETYGQQVAFSSIERFNHVDIVASAPQAARNSVPRVNVYDAETGELKFQVLAYANTFRGGVNVTTADINGDGLPDLLVAPGAGTPATLKIYNGTPDAAGNYAAALLTSFNVFTSNRGVNLAAADVNGDGYNDVIAAAGSGWLPQIKVFNGVELLTTRALVGVPFLAFENRFRGGVTVAAGDLNNDGHAEIVAGRGPGKTPEVRIFNGKNFELVHSFNAFASSKRGVNVAVGDVNGDGVRDIIIGAGRNDPPNVAVFSGANAFTKAPLELLVNFLAYEKAFRGGVNVAVKPVNGGDPGSVEEMAIWVSYGPSKTSRAIRQAFYTGRNLSPTLVDMLFENGWHQGGAAIG